MLARVESRAQEKGCRTSAPIVREGIAAPDPEKAGASPLLAGGVPDDDLRNERQACFRFLREISTVARSPASISM